MIVNLPMIQRGIRRLLAGKPAQFESQATSTRTFCAEETHALRPAIYLDGTMDKMKSLSPWRDWKLESLLIHGGTRRSTATMGYLIENVRIVEACLYVRESKDHVGFGAERLMFPVKEALLRLDKANLVTTWSGSHFFGCMVHDDLPLELVPDDPENNIRLISKPYSHEAEYRSLLGLSATPLVRNAHIRQLMVFEDPTHNSFKAARYRELREQMRKSIGHQSAADNPGVYLKRGATGEPRAMINEAEIELLLEKRGYDIVDTSSLSADEIAKRTLGARIVVGVEGSHLTHAIFTMADDAAMVVIQPPTRLAMVYKEFTDCLDMKFAFLVGDEAADGFSVPPDDVSRLLDLVD